MSPRKIDEDELLERLTRVFTLHGYEGASLSRISVMTGLQRASLYHRFPGGKEEMAEAVLARADAIFLNHILAPLSGPGEPAARIRSMARRLDEFYASGKRTCLLDSLSLGEPDSGIFRHVHGSFQTWLDALAGVAREAGASPAAARRLAADALIRIQGALVFTRITGDKRPFKRVLDSLPALLTA